MSVTVECYTLEGFKLVLNLPANTVDEALAHVQAVVSAGLSPVPVEAGTSPVETIVTVVRREHIGKNDKVTPVIDFYPEWQGEYGQFRFCGVYLNTPDDIAQFEAHSGLKLANMPLYDAQAPLQRNPARRHKAEVSCKPFVARKAADGEKEIDGKKQTTWKFAGYGSSAPQADTPAPAAQTSQPAAQPTQTTNILSSNETERWSKFIEWAMNTFAWGQDKIESVLSYRYWTPDGLQGPRDDMMGAVLAAYCNFDATRIETEGKTKKIPAAAITAAKSVRKPDEIPF